MAGEIQEPFSFGFRADSIHSGSISFGRFEKESLSWERRSAFSHNKYLEEVEKYSKPGSVIEKKAYFEAHFKKKGILFPASLEAQTWRFNQTGKNGGTDGAGNRNEAKYMTESNNNYQSDGRFIQNSSQLDSPCNYGHEGAKVDQGNEWSQYEYAGEGNHCVHYSESPASTEYGGVFDEMELGKEERGPQSEVLVESINEDARSEESFRDKLGCPWITLEIKVTDSSKDKEGDGDESPKSFVETSSENSQNVLTMLRSDATEGMLSAPRPKSQENFSPFEDVVPNKETKNSPNSQNRKEKDTSGRTKGITSSSPKVKGYRSSNSKADMKINSQKEPRPQKAVKATVSQPSTSKKILNQTPLAMNRHKTTIDSTGREKRTGSCGFHFKSCDRAEKRKEFYVKLGDKVHAKEVEMNRIQAKTQEKAEAEIKQFRKSQNFKATPMPSFDNSGARMGPHNKPATAKAASDKATSLVNAASTRPSSATKAGNRHHSISFHSSSARKPSSEASDRQSSTKAALKSRVKSNKQRTEKDHNMQNGKVEAKQNAGAMKSNNDKVRKSMNNMGIRESSGIRHLTVGVAS